MSLKEAVKIIAQQKKASIKDVISSQLAGSAGSRTPSWCRGMKKPASIHDIVKLAASPHMSKKVRKTWTKRARLCCIQLAVMFCLENIAWHIVCQWSCDRQAGKYPKVDLQPREDASPGPRSLRAAFSWADRMVQAVSKKVGVQLMSQKLASWRWHVTTCFSGLGCAEAVWGLAVMEHLPWPTCLDD